MCNAFGVNPLCRSHPQGGRLRRDPGGLRGSFYFCSKQTIIILSERKSRMSPFVSNRAFVLSYCRGSLAMVTGYRTTTSTSAAEAQVRFCTSEEATSFT